MDRNNPGIWRVMDDSTDGLIRPEDFPLPNRSQESLCSRELISWNITPPLPAVLHRTTHLESSVPPPSLASETLPTESIGPRQSVRKRWPFILLLYTLIIVAFVTALDATSLSVALPVIAREFNASTFQSFWIGISYLLTAVLFQPIHTALSDVFGRKEVLYLCFVCFATGSIIVGSSKTIDALIAGRALQGVGGGSLEVLSEAILRDITTPAERPLYLSILSLIWAAGSAFGPLIGATFAGHATWRWIAWVNLPLLAIPVLLIPVYHALRPFKFLLASRLVQIDWIGISLFIPAITLLVLAMNWSGSLYEWSSTATVALVSSGLLFLIAFVIREGFAHNPMFPCWLFSRRTRLAGLFGALAHGAVFYSVILFIPIYLEGSVQLDPVHAAINMLPLSVLVSVSALVTTFGIRRVLCYYWCIWAGWFLTTLGSGLLILLDSKSSAALWLGLQVVGAIGLGVLFPAVAAPLHAEKDDEHSDGLTRNLALFRQLGAVVGVALGSGIFSTAFSTEIAKFSPLPGRLSSLSDGSGAISLIPLLKTLDVQAEETGVVYDVYGRAMRGIWIAIAIIGTLGLLSSVLTVMDRRPNSVKWTTQR